MVENFFNCYVNVNHMHDEKNQGLMNNELSLRNTKVCPCCLNFQINYRKRKRNYICRNCAEEFNIPVLKQIKDRRNELPIPPSLRKYEKANI
jgi:hypothetical protein